MFLLLMSFWMFSFSTSSSPYIISTPFIRSPMLHASCFMLTPSLLIHYSDMMSVPPRCISSRSSFRWILVFFVLFLRWKDTLDIIIPSSAGREISSLFCSYSSYLYPSISLHYRPLTLSAGPWAHPSPTTSKSPFLFNGYLFNLSFVIHYLFKFFFSLVFIIKFQKNSDFSFFLCSLRPLPR